MTTTAHLRTIALHWTDLQDALGGASAPVWPPAGRMRDYLRSLDDLDAEEAEAERHRALALRTLERDPAQLGERPIPIRLRIHDTMRIVRASWSAGKTGSVPAQRVEAGTHRDGQPTVVGIQVL